MAENFEFHVMHEYLVVTHQTFLQRTYYNVDFLHYGTILM